jgi:alpha-glucosidase
VRDPFGINMPGGTQGRDPVRTPMPWDRSRNAGFSSGEPWLPLAPHAAEISVEAQKQEPSSHLSLTRALIALRNAEPALNAGSFEMLHAEGGALGYLRRAGERRFAIVLDAESKPARVALPAAGRIVVCTTVGRIGEKMVGSIDIAADEAAVILLD